LHTGIDQCAAQIAVTISAADWRAFFFLFCHKNIVDSVHYRALAWSLYTKIVGKENYRE
jgi:hypothetical protein